MKLAWIRFKNYDIGFYTKFKFYGITKNKTLNLGLGTTFKASSFKIPHKAKSSDNPENTDEPKAPLTSSSPPL